MTELAQIVSMLSDKFREHVSLQTDTRCFRIASKRYVKKMLLLSTPYQHHRAESADIEQLISRFTWETAVYWTVFSVLKTLINRRFPLIDTTYLLEDKLPFFDWYCRDDDLTNVLDGQLAIFDAEPIEELVLALSEICGQMLVETNSRTTGEFYTPRGLAEHLIQMSGLKETDILENASLVDPSCGGGIILLTAVSNTVQYIISNRKPVQSDLDALTTNVYGYDIQPFAISLTRLMLHAICTPLYASNDLEITAFRNICLRDPLQSIEYSKFTYIIGNPPYLPVKRKQVDFIKNYDDVVHGHINLYGLFLWWAVSAAVDHGIIAFLVPQTLVGGLYFEKLRLALHRTTYLRAVTRMTDRKGIVGDADQQIMAICLEKSGNIPAPTEEDFINVIVTHNGADVADCTATPVGYRRVIKHLNQRSLWVVSDNVMDYAIQEAIESRLNGTIGELSPNIVCQNGGFVWNEHSDRIFETGEVGTVPLVSSGAIAPFVFKFPYSMKNPQHRRTFVKWNSESGEKAFTGTTVLIQRVTPRKTGRRITATVIDRNFVEKHPYYLVENHVNVIAADDNDLLMGITGWLNSDLAQFIFQMRNGNAHISVYELQNLPCDRSVLLELAPLVREISSKTTSQSINQAIQSLNEFLYEYFALTPVQIARVIEALARKHVKLETDYQQ